MGVLTIGGQWGERFKLSIFGESHGKGVGIVLDGVPAGLKLDMEMVTFDMQRRRPGYSKLVSSRKESDEVEVMSGIFQGFTTGAPLMAFIRNKGQRSKDYESIKYLVRPGHADYTANIKYKGFNDYRGGGHFSGRLTAPLVFAGAVAKQILEAKGIIIGCHIAQIGDVNDKNFSSTACTQVLLDCLRRSDFPVLDQDAGRKMKGAIEQVKREGDSVGGKIECVAVGLPAGIGEPFFNSIESSLAHMMFSIPAVKAIEFGAGTNFANMNGSSANDPFCLHHSNIRTVTNNAGGILGGISTGMPLLFSLTVKPTPSIAQEQNTVDISSRKETKIAVDGRHDPCIVPRVVPVVEAACAIALVDLMMQK